MNFFYVRYTTLRIEGIFNFFNCWNTFKRSSKEQCRIFPHKLEYLTFKIYTSCIYYLYFYLITIELSFSQVTLLILTYLHIAHLSPSVWLKTAWKFDSLQTTKLEIYPRNFYREFSTFMLIFLIFLLGMRKVHFACHFLFARPDIV